AAPRITAHHVSRRLPVRGLMGESRPPADCAKRFICSFPDCEATFSKAWRLNAHLCRHTGERPFICNYNGCGKGFTRDFHLTRHFLTHSGEKPFDKSFRKHQQLKVHHCQHTSEPFFKCSHEACGKHFLTPSRLKRHEKIHEGYACKKDNCSFVGKTWTEHLKHMKDCHAEPVICGVCSKTFKRKDYLRQHQKTHAEEREVCRCPREGCGRTYTTVFNLQSHILSFHEEKKPFFCDYAGCGKVFAMKQSLARHAVVHDPDKGKLNLKAKQTRPKRSLASRLSGYIPPKAQRRKLEAATENKALNKPAESELPTVETLTLH
uniref:Transcription factor IIIA n=1 Tax=Gopherus agassizii TaxID=38772 RepID=A0A452GZ63_9SAUR